MYGDFSLVAIAQGDLEKHGEVDLMTKSINIPGNIVASYREA